MSNVYSTGYVSLAKYTDSLSAPTCFRQVAVLSLTLIIAQIFTKLCCFCRILLSLVTLQGSVCSHVRWSG